MKCGESALSLDRSSTDIVLYNENDTEYLRYLHGLMQPVIVLMSSYRNRCKLSYKSSIILNQAAVVIAEKSNLSTCTLGHHYKMGYSCHLSSSSTWFYNQPQKIWDGRKAIWSFYKPLWCYSSGHRWRSCIQDQGCMGPQEGPAPLPYLMFRQVQGCSFHGQFKSTVFRTFFFLGSTNYV